MLAAYIYVFTPATLSEAFLCEDRSKTYKMFSQRHIPFASRVL